MFLFYLEFLVQSHKKNPLHSHCSEHIMVSLQVNQYPYWQADQVLPVWLALEFREDFQACRKEPDLPRKQTREQMHEICTIKYDAFTSKSSRGNCSMSLRTSLRICVFLCTSTFSQSSGSITFGFTWKRMKQSYCLIRQKLGTGKTRVYFIRKISYSFKRIRQNPVFHITTTETQIFGIK